MGSSPPVLLSTLCKKQPTISMARTCRLGAVIHFKMRPATPPSDYHIVRVKFVQHPVTRCLWEIRRGSRTSSCQTYVPMSSPILAPRLSAKTLCMLMSFMAACTILSLGMERGLGRAASIRISTITSHGCIKHECRAETYQVASKRANEWFVIDCDRRTQDPELTVGWLAKRNATFSMREQEKRTRGKGQLKKRGESMRSSSDAKSTNNR